MLGPWRTATTVVSYLRLALGLGGLLGNGLLLRHLGLCAPAGPPAVYARHLAAADLLFLGCQAAFAVAPAVPGAPATLPFAVTFVAFAAGLWLLAALGLELCAAELCPRRRRAGCRPRHTAGAVCGLGWALTPPAVLLPADACGLLRGGARPGACLRLHAAGVAWLAALVCGVCGAGLALLLRAACCPARPRPRLHGPLLGSALLLALCGLPYVLLWSLRPLLGLLPLFPPLAGLLACVPAAARPLLYMCAGRQPGERQPLRAVLQRALGDRAPPGPGGLALPMGTV